MTSYIDNLLTLIETTQEEQDRLSDAAAEEQQGRHTKMIAILKAAATKIGLDIAEHNYSIGYDEDDNREAHIDVYNGVTMEQLYALTDLADSVKVDDCPSHIDVIRLTMRMKPGMEDAMISEAKYGVVSSQTLGHLKRWDAEHVLDVSDEVKSRGQSAIDGAALKQASDDIDFAGRALPATQGRTKPIRSIAGRAPKVTPR